MRSTENDFETKFRRREVPADVPERSVTDLEDLPGSLVEAGLALPPFEVGPRQARRPLDLLVRFLTR